MIDSRHRQAGSPRRRPSTQTTQAWKTEHNLPGGMQAAMASVFPNSSFSATGAPRTSSSWC